MSRIRTIKPDFFLNDSLADLPALDRLLFIGLWTQADREGRLEDRPRKIKAAILPYDDYDIDAALTRLQEKTFIIRYGLNGSNYLQITNFLKHQYPNVKEQASIIPAPCKHSTSTPRLRKGTIKGKEGNNKEPENGSCTVFDFNLVWSKYPNKDGRKDAEKHFTTSVKTEQDYSDILKALDNYLQSEKVGEGFVKMGSTWFNNWRDWISPSEAQMKSGKKLPEGYI